MAEITIFLSDLKASAQDAICRELKKQLLNMGEVAPQGKDESDMDFELRLEDEIELYFKYHRSDNLFCLYL